MWISSSVDFYPGSREERLHGYTPQWPCVSSHVQLDRHPQGQTPWHWHKSVELFYMESGSLVYYTPGGQRVFRAGMGGLVNSNVLHRTRALGPTLQLLHLFDPALVAGIPGGDVERKFVTPLLHTPGLELIVLDPADAQQAETLRLVRESLALDEDAYGFELRLQAMLCEIWLRLAAQVRPAEAPAAPSPDSDAERVKRMILYIHSSYAEKLTVAAIAAAGYCSERACYRAFRSCLHTTPADYVQSVRIQAACRLLIETDRPVTAIAQECGLGSASYFGAQFRAQLGCTPTAYRQKWQDLDS